MADTLSALCTHLATRFERPKVVVWAHNSHVGDARATKFVQRGQLNLGQLVRERSAEGTLLIGFSTYGGSVTAASDWDRPAEQKPLKTPHSDSWEDVFHRCGLDGLLLKTRDLRLDPPAAAELDAPRLQRAIGVIYKPATERFSHYFSTQLRKQFDAIIHIDQTRALEPLERVAPPASQEEPDTFPTGI